MRCRPWTCCLLWLPHPGCIAGPSPRTVRRRPPDRHRVAREESRMTSRSRRRALVLAIGAGLVVVLAALVVLALPLVKARSEAKDAVASLQDANTALKAHQFGQAKTSIDAAQSQVSAAEEHSSGFGADVWAHVPILGGAVQDARHLVSALDQATAVGDLGLRTYRHATGPHATLIEHDQVDMVALRRLVALTSRIGP